MRSQPSVPGQRAWVVFDVVSAAAVTALITSEILVNWHHRDWAVHGDPQPGGGEVIVILAGVLACGAALAARRWRPLLSAAVVLAVWLGLLAAAWPLAEGVLGAFEIMSTVLLYSVAVTEPPHIAAAALVTLLAADTATVAGSPSHHRVNNIIDTGLALLLAWGLGVGVARYRDIGARLRAQQDAAARAELDRERVRLARELHDVLAHSMSVVNVQAGYGRFAIGRDPAAAEAALAAIQEVSREAMVEMRGMLAVLRDGGEAAVLAPAPRLADLPRLVATCAEAGVTVRVRTCGAVRELPDGLELAAFRIVQEALTNVVKHAHTHSAQVLLEYQDTALTVTVCDAGRGGPEPMIGARGADGAGGAGGTGLAGAAAAGRAGAGHGHGAAGSQRSHGGHGLAGIAERVGLYEGALQAGPLAGGGWQVRAVLPCPSPAGTAEPDTAEPDTAGAPAADSAVRVGAEAGAAP